MRFGGSQCADERSPAGGPRRKPRQRARDPARRSYLCRKQRGLGSKSGRRAENGRPAELKRTFIEKAIEHLQNPLNIKPMTNPLHPWKEEGDTPPPPLYQKTRKQPPGVF